jgi:hypothetical protein
MKPFSSKTIYAAVLGITLAAAPLAAFAQEGPRASSYGNWSGMMNAAPPAAEPAVTPFDGARPSSLNNWHGMTGTSNPIGASSADPSFDGPRPSPNH